MIACGAWYQYINSSEYLTLHQAQGSREDYRETLCNRSPNWPETHSPVKFLYVISELSQLMSFFCAFTFAGLVYGGIHLLAWNAPLTNETQWLLWRLSAVIVAASGPGLFVLRILGHFKGPNLGLMVSTMPLRLLALLVYFAARLYLVVECFIYSAYLPDLAFEQVQWSQYFPHIS
jgi:hypothetical protein